MDITDVFVYICTLLYNIVCPECSVSCSSAQAGAALPMLPFCRHALMTASSFPFSTCALLLGRIGRQGSAFRSCHLALPTLIFGSSSECSSQGGGRRRRDAGCTCFDSFRLPDGSGTSAETAIKDRRTNVGRVLHFLVIY